MCIWTFKLHAAMLTESDIMSQCLMENVKSNAHWNRNGVVWFNVDMGYNLPLMNWSGARCLLEILTEIWLWKKNLREKKKKSAFKVIQSEFRWTGDDCRWLPCDIDQRYDMVASLRFHQFGGESGPFFFRDSCTKAAKASLIHILSSTWLRSTVPPLTTPLQRLETAHWFIPRPQGSCVYYTV